MNFLLLQINDALFPIGSYAHSFGLESYVQLHCITNQKEAKDYLISYLHTQFLYTDLLAIKLIFEAKDLEAILSLETLLQASISASQTCNGMQKIGIRFIKTIEAMEVKTEKVFKNYANTTPYSLYPIVYGVFCKANQFNFKNCIKHYIYSQSSNVLTNCVKLIPLAQSDGQKILLCLHKEFDNIYIKLQYLQEMDFCSISVHNEIKAMQHENLYSRLYMS